MDTGIYTISFYVPEVMSHLSPMIAQKRTPFECPVLSHCHVNMTQLGSAIFTLCYFLMHHSQRDMQASLRYE